MPKTIFTLLFCNNNILWISFKNKISRNKTTSLLLFCNNNICNYNKWLQVNYIIIIIIIIIIVYHRINIVLILFLLCFYNIITTTTRRRCKWPDATHVCRCCTRANPSLACKSDRIVKGREFGQRVAESEAFREVDYNQVADMCYYYCDFCFS
jgi:hypothetical protein